MRIFTKEINVIESYIPESQFPYPRNHDEDIVIFLSYRR